MDIFDQYSIKTIEDIHLVHSFKSTFTLKVWCIIEIIIYLLMKYKYI